MIAFGSAITRPEEFARCAQPGITRAAEPDSVVYTEPAIGSLFESYNSVMDMAAQLEDLEALVLLHQDTELVDRNFCETARRALGDPDVGVVGCVGAIGVRSIAWWEGSVTLASFIHRYGEHGGGDLPAFSWAWEDAPPYARIGQVDTLDGFLLVMSPWVVRNIRFDESLGQLHGYDLDFCLQARAAGRKVVTADFRAIHHHSLELVNDPEGWIQAHIKIADKWEGRIAGIGAGAGTWKQRAQRAEAEADASRAKAHSNALLADAQVRALEYALSETTGSLSWRLTAPLRTYAGFTRRLRGLTGRVSKRRRRA